MVDMNYKENKIMIIKIKRKCKTWNNKIGAYEWSCTTKVYNNIFCVQFNYSV